MTTEKQTGYTPGPWKLDANGVVVWAGLPDGVFTSIRVNGHALIKGR